MGVGAQASNGPRKEKEPRVQRLTGSINFYGKAEMPFPDPSAESGVPRARI